MSNDNELKNYLQDESDLSKLYHEMPPVNLPDHLDAAILAEAHRAVGSRPGGKSRHRWTIPLSMVATLFLVVMIGLQLPQMLKDAELTQMPLEENAAVSVLNKNMEQRAVDTDDERNKMQSTARSKTDILSAERELMAIKSEKPSSTDVQKPVLSNASAGISALTGGPSAPAAKNVPESLIVTQPAPAVAAKRFNEQADFEQGRLLANQKKTIGSAEGKVSNALKQEIPAPALMAAPKPVQLEHALMQESKDEVITNQVDETKSSEISLSKEDWLARIRKLKQQGKLNEAKKELTAFKKRYPDYQIPESFDVR